MTIALLSLLLFAIFLFGIAVAGRKIQLGNATQPLVTLGSLGALSYFGLTEMAGRYGLEALLAFMAFTLAFLFGPLVMRPVHWAAQTRRLPTLADLFSYRYRHSSIGPLVTIVLALSCLPLLAGQVQMAGSSLQFMSSGELPVTPAKLLFALLITALLLLFGQRATHSRRLMTTLAAGALITLVALVFTTWWACWHYFGHPMTMQQWANANDFNQSIHRSGNSYGLISLFLLASLTLPHLYHQQSWHPSSQSRALTGWLFPLLLLIATLCMVPLLWSGLAARLPVSLQLYLPGLAANSGSPALQLLTTVGGLFACTTITVTATQALVAMASNHLLPTTINQPSDNLYQRLIRKRQALIISWIALILVTSQLVTTNSISTLTVVALVGIVQLTPGLLSALYAPILNRRGITAGLIAGILLWMAGLLLPLFINSWQWTLSADTQLRFGIDNWNNWLLISLATNFAISLLVTRHTKSSLEESLYARASMIEKVSAPQRIAAEQCHLPDVQHRLTECIGEVAAIRELTQIIRIESDKTIGNIELRPFEWRQLRSQLTTNLYQLLGVCHAEQVINRTLPLADNGEFNMGDLRSLESLLAERQQPLYGLAAELNKLRIHHQNILYELPLGACSLDQDNEIVLWNDALQNITGIASSTATGSHIDALPEPWRQVLSEAADSNTAHKFAIEVASNNRKVRFNLHKSIVQSRDKPFTEQVILLDDVSDVIQLTQEIAHTERLASIGRLAAGVAHEIGNPVTGIACLAQDIHSDSTDDEQRQSATMILNQVERITRIVRSLIDFSRSGSESDIQITDVSLQEVLQQAVQLLTLSRDNIEIQIDAPEQLIVRGDSHQLVQIFLNLLSNAHDANDHSDTVTVAAHRAESHAKIQIIDHGTGISADKLDKVLEPFFTTKPAGEGTGLGLSLVYSMVRSYGGELSLQSPVANNRGTCVTVTLPLDQQ